VIEMMSIYSFKKSAKIITFSIENMMICDDHFNGCFSTDKRLRDRKRIG